ncbi:hypothetical protein N7468_010791 [Penicillium chermesinum]|uniref:Uncharacterized protein n=1 Tax=Penicillium chermesinum TaxID=63820 RepID=A0A9W9N8A3_9EURO|nr:uncharacterized protein N7468_010791 [Penicillium chermesinum]KAJ5215112.1 hypothetical protein N7468_010791 [Penicillium chermesinum]
MHVISTVPFAATLLSGLAAAAPQAPQGYQGGWVPTASIQLSNEESGTNSNAVIPVDGVYRPVQELWGNTPSPKTASKDPHTHLDLSSDRTYAVFGGPVVDLCTAYVACDWARW